MRLEEGKLLGDWKLIKEIGYGALGHSIVAEHRFTKQKVVLKVLPEDLASDRSFVTRFEEEALVLAGLEHPHIAKTYTVSFIGGLYLLVIECVVDSKKETTTLQKLVKETKLTPRQILQIGEQIAQALDYAHTMKTIGGAHSFSHGNIKPSNILIASSDDQADSSKIKVKLSDFGLSRIVGQATWLMRSYNTMVERLFLEETKPHGALRSKGGRPFVYNDDVMLKIAQNCMFLSPEQRHGDWSTPHESDIWSFGVLLYWLISEGSYPEGSWDTDFDALGEPSLEIETIRNIIRTCVRQSPGLRPKLILPLLQSIYVQQEEKRVITASPIPVTAIMTEIEEKKTPSLSTSPEESSKGTSVLKQMEENNKTTIKEYIPEKRDNRNIEPLLNDMVLISQGTYFRGSNQGCRDEMPRHQVNINSFRIDIHPVTNEQFVRFLEFVGDEKDKQNHDLIRLRDSRIKKSSGRCVIERGYGKHPVVGVTWYGAQSYAAWIGKRLPTEVEWEIACYGGLENAIYPTGEDIERPQANFFSSDTTPVMSYPANGYGLYDIVGNVYEWCQDWYEYNYYDFSAMEPDNPKGPIQGVYRVLRGGCWKSLKEDLRCSKRHRNNPGAANGTYGFRCASDI